MLNTTRTSNRLARKRKVAMIVDESSDEEEEPPKKKQKITKKAAAPKKVNNRKKRKEESDDDEEDISDADVPRNNSKKKATADSDDESEPDYDDESAEDADDWAVLKPGKKTDFAELKATALKKLLASADTGAYQSLGEEEYTLPDELLLQIFGHFTRKQLHIVGLACRQWLRLSNDQSLGWHLATSVVLKENAWQYFEYFKAGDVNRYSINNLSEDAKVATLKQYKDHFLEERPSMPTAVAVTNGKTHLVDEHGTVIRHVAAVTPVIHLNHFQFFPLDWVQLNSDPELWSYRITKASVEEVQTVLGYEDYKNLETQNDQWVVDIEINIKRLEDLVTKHDTGYTIDRYYYYYQDNREKEESAIPGMKLIYPLVEQDFLQRITSISSSKFSFIPRRSFTAQQQPDGFKDEMKLYKYQLDAISWMKSVEDNKDGLPYFTAYPWRRARTELLFDLQPERKTVVTDLEKYVDVVQPKGAVLADEMGLGKTLEMIGLILSSPAPTKLPKHRALITSRATLVLCPNHLVMQWSDELTKSTNLKVAVAATIVQLKKFTYQDFIDYDVVIASYQLLENPKYFFLESNQKKRSSIRQHEEAERSEWVESSLKETKRNKQGMKKKCPILEHFYWHRMVLDEGHEYLAKPYFNYIISTSFSRFAWYVTGTPFPTLDHFKYVKRFIGVQSGFKQYTQQQETLMTDLMLRELYWRHTKASVQGEYKIPDYVEDLVLVEFDEIEKVLYADERKEADQSHMCGSLLQSSTLDSRLEELIHRKRRSIEDDAQRGVPGAISALAGAQRFFDNEKDAFKKAVALTVLEKRKKELVEAKATQEHNKKVLELALKVTPFAKRDKKNLNEHSKLIEQHGTKLVQMIVYLKKLFARKPDSRVIFFSQFEDTLTNVSQILSEYDVPNVFVEGNIWKRTKALNNFKKDEDVKVIMLSLKNAASGTNLVAATHVILMDPVTGSKKEAQAIESQAIGRAFRQGQTKQITIVRFVVRNTIEHALYLRNNDVNEDTTVVMTKDNKPQLVRSSSAAMLKRSSSVGLLEMKNNTNIVESNKMTDD